MAKKHGPNKENLEATRRIFLDIARSEFSKEGYYNASTARIVEESGMARGSLYYHFGDKKGLFGAVYEELMLEIQTAVCNRVAAIKDPFEGVIAASLLVMDMCMESTTRRIIIDVHTAITYAERLEILGRTALLELHKLLKSSLEAGYFKGHSIQSLSILIFGMVSEGSRSFELADDVGKARSDLGAAFTLLMENARG